MNADSTERSWRRTGCLLVVAVLGLVLLGAAIVVGVAYRQIRTEAREVRSSVQAIPEEADPGGGPPRPEPARTGRLELDISIAQLTVVPAKPGEPIRVDAEYDSRSYRLEQSSGDLAGDGWTYRLRFAPISSSLMALLRIKLGADPPTVRIALPRDVRLVLTGEVDGAFAAMELGGLWLDTVDIRVSGGAVAVSFLEPLRTPMERLSLTGDKGSVKVVGLGAASPRKAVLEQHLGELDLDLRGPWSRDADIRVRAFVAGGSVWLPGGVAIEGVDGRLPQWGDPIADETPRPRLRLSVTERGGRLVFVE